MAGISWIKIETTFPSKPVVLKLRRILNLSRSEVIGNLIRVLCWADGVTSDGALGGMTVEDIDEVVTCEGFGAALVAVGWLVESDGVLSFHEWDMHNGTTAKKRAVDARRKEVTRMSQKCPKKSGQNADETRTSGGQIAELDKIREDKRNTSVFPKAHPPADSAESSAQRFTILTGKGEQVSLEYDRGNDRFLKVYGKQPMHVAQFQLAWAEACREVDPEILIQAARLDRDKLIESGELNFQEVPERWLANRKYDQWRKEATQVVKQRASSSKLKVRTFSTKGLEI